jgi:hypothetical protein
MYGYVFSPFHYGWKEFLVYPVSNTGDPEVAETGTPSAVVELDFKNMSILLVQ